MDTSEFSDFTVIPSKEASFEEMWAPLSELRSVSLRVESAPNVPKGFLSAKPLSFDSKNFACLYSDKRLCPGESHDAPASTLLKELFETRRFTGLVFNPANPAGKSAGFSRRLDRVEWSSLAGFLGLGGKKPDDPVSQSLIQYKSGMAHSAHYCLSFVPDQPHYKQHKFFLVKTLIFLRLYEKTDEIMRAYFAVNPKTTQTCLLMSLLNRKAGNLKQAAIWLETAKGYRAGEDDALSAIALETAWINMEAGSYISAGADFKHLLNHAVYKHEAHLGLGILMRNIGIKDNDPKILKEAVSHLNEASLGDGLTKTLSNFHLGTIYSKLADWQTAETFYRKSAAMCPSMPAQVNLTLSLIKLGKMDDAAQLCKKIYLAEPELAGGIIAMLQPILKTKTPDIVNASEDISSEPEHSSAPLRGTVSSSEAKESAPLSRDCESSNTPTDSAAPPARDCESSNTPTDSAAPLSPSNELPAVNFEFVKPRPRKPFIIRPPVQPQSYPLEPEEIKVENMGASAPAAAPKQTEEIKTQIGGAPPEKPAVIQFQSALETVRSLTPKTTAGDFMTRAWAMAAAVKEETGKNIRFDIDGIREVEKMLRLTFLKSRHNPVHSLQLVLNSAAFICFYLEQRHGGKLQQFQDQDAWTWNMTFEKSGLSTFPIEKCWHFLRTESPPEPGWITGYIEYLESELTKPQSKPVSGPAAAINKIQSSPHKLFDTNTEHRRILLLLPALEETKTSAVINREFRRWRPP